MKMLSNLGFLFLLLSMSSQHWIRLPWIILPKHRLWSCPSWQISRLPCDLSWKAYPFLNADDLQLLTLAYEMLQEVPVLLRYIASKNWHFERGDIILLMVWQFHCDIVHCDVSAVLNCYSVYSNLFTHQHMMGTTSLVHLLNGSAVSSALQRTVESGSIRSARCIFSILP